MSALAAEVAGSFARGFMLLDDLRRLDAQEHAEIMGRVIEQVGAITHAERDRRALESKR